MKKTLKNITAYIALSLIILTSCGFQMHFKHCNKTNITDVSALKCFQYQKTELCSESDYCQKCSESHSCNANDTVHNDDHKIPTTQINYSISDNCCFEYHKFYQNDFTSESPVRICNIAIEYPTFILHEGFNIIKSDEKSKVNQSDFVDISPHPIIKQIIKSILQKSIQSPDETIS
jgi:hypothetical protein